MTNVSTSKPRVSTLIVLGEAWAPKLAGYQPVLWAQLRGFLRPDGTPLGPTSDPGERSLFGEHIKDGLDTDSLGAAVRCAHQEFWLAQDLTREDFTPLASDVETPFSINDVFLLNRFATPRNMGMGEGDGLISLFLPHVPWYMENRKFTNASLACLAAAGDIQALYEEVRFL